ncbi:MAG TPA: pirin family protein, partial [Flavisolibacter sp.]|nr:pirin family protein [Flavisolibacter sp.]
MIQRKLEIIQTPHGEPGFLGKGHTARAVIQRTYQESDPFILLMDDFLDKQDEEPAGGPHPHGGFETVSLLLEGEIGDSAHKMKAGDFQLMTAGSGVIHTESIESKIRMRLLQLWLVLPKKDRWASPRIQDLTAAQVPVLHEKGVSIRLYSGTLHGVSSPVQNYTPLLIADITLDSGTEKTLQFPAQYNSFLYMLNGTVAIGDDAAILQQDQVGWLAKSTLQENGALLLKAGKEGARLVLYAGQPQGD